MMLPLESKKLWLTWHRKVMNWIYLMGGEY
jgi:hypothetical protein